MSAPTTIFNPVGNARPAHAAFQAARLPFASRDNGVTFNSRSAFAVAPEQPDTSQPDAPETPDAPAPGSEQPLTPDAISTGSVPAVSSPEETVDQDTLASARAEAYAAGLAAARADAMTELETARDVFIAAHRALVCAPEQIEAFSTQVEQAVMRLASERAGLAIDSTPAPFLRRIEQLATTISEATSDMSVMLNPADLNAIAPHLQDSQCSAFRFQADPGLQRGDARLAQPTVLLSDILGEDRK